MWPPVSHRYLRARRTFDALAGRTPQLAARVARLQAAGVELSRRADEQKTVRSSRLEAEAGARLSRRYERSSGGGVPWVQDELGPNYLPQERARFSCVNCSGDVVPEKDLIGCWPLWTQFAPDELSYRCTRKWTSDPGLQDPPRYKQHRAPMPCWQTCWAATPALLAGRARAGAVGPGQAGAATTALGRCTAACPTDGEPAVAWRRRWNVERKRFLRDDPVGRAWVESHAFVTPLKMDNFIFSVY